MVSKEIPERVLEAINRITRDGEIQTPFNLYDERGVRETIRGLHSAFSWVSGKGFQNYFAVKASPLPILIDILRQEGAGFDCSSEFELELSDRLGIRGEEIMFTSNDTPLRELQLAFKLGAIINLDDIKHIPMLRGRVGTPDLISFRFNPGAERTGNSFIGKPVEAKYGLTREQIFEAYKIMRDAGSTRFGLHTMVASNELESQYFVETGRMLLDLVAEISNRLEINFDFINLGGGIGVPYRPGEEPVDLEYVSEGIENLYREKIEGAGLKPLRIVAENGRMVAGPHGYLVSKVRWVTKKHKDFVGLDSCMADFMRPGVYGKDCYHHITVIGRDGTVKTGNDHVYDVTGSLCENSDKFAVNRALPQIEEGDIVVLHDTGAHGRAMGFNYNGKPRCGEYLLRENGSVLMMREPETVEDLFKGLEMPEK